MSSYTEREKKIYDMGRYSGARRVVIGILGDKCLNCGNTNLYDLQVHHIKSINGRSRQLNMFFDLEDIEILCIKCHTETGGWRNRA